MDSRSTDAETSRKQRRVAEEHRKRSAQSCDYCRKKRCKCVLSASRRETCVACVARNIACTYTLPRKTRFYGSTEDLSDRYRCLDAIVRAAFPNEATATALDLWHLGQRKGYRMPEISARGVHPASSDEIVRPDAFECELTSIPGPDPENNGSSIRPSASGNQDRTLAQFSSVDGNFQLVRSAMGGEHYIGRSGSLQFFAQLRHLLASRNTDGGHNDDSATAKFTQDDTAHALEADGAQAAAGDVEMEHGRTTGHSAGDAHPTAAANSYTAETFTGLSAEGVQAQILELPRPETMEPLLQSYWEHMHQDFPLFHRGTFEEEYETFMNRPRPWRHDQCNWGWIGCLRMMLVFGSISGPCIPNINHRALRRQCVVATRHLLPQLVSRCTLPNLRALILLSLFLHDNNERNASWVLLGTAVRVSIALGLHKASTLLSFRPIERETRKRVFCTLYCFEQFLASSLGRASGLNDIDVELNPPKGGLLDGSNAGGDQLVKFSSDIHQVLAKARVASENLNGRPVSTDNVLRSLEAWSRSVSANPSRYIPPIRLGIHLFESFESDAMDISQLRIRLGWQDPTQLRETLLLHAEYRYVGLLVTRPSLLGEVIASNSQSRSTLTTESKDSLSTTCLWHACQLAQIILLLDSFGLLKGVSSLDIFYAYSAAMVLMLRLLRRPSNSGESSRTREQETAIEKCLEDMTSRLKGAAAKVHKSGTMQRFALVMTTFDACISHRKPYNPTLIEKSNTPAHRDSNQYSPSHFPTADSMQVTSSLRLSPDPGLSTADMGGLLDIDGLTTYTGWPGGIHESFGAAPNSDLWMGTNTAMVDGLLSGWGDPESLLAHLIPR